MYLENQELKREIKILQQENNELKQLITPQKQEKITQKTNFNDILKEAEEAMKRYTNELKREGLKYAKQK